MYTPDIMFKLLGTQHWDTCKIAVREMKLPISVEKFSNEFISHTNKNLPNVPLIPGTLLS